jgi:hypothetical protein
VRRTIARLRAKYGSLSPDQVVRAAAEEAKRAATPTAAGACLPYSVKIGVHAKDLGAWKPLKQQLARKAAEAIAAACPGRS